jgi:hypothetical protein
LRLPPKSYSAAEFTMVWLKDTLGDKEFTHFVPPFLKPPQEQSINL